MTDALVLGTEPGTLRIVVVTGDPWATTLILKENGVPIAWPDAPVLEFVDFNVTATLSADEDTSTANSQATWSMTEDQVNQLVAYKPVRLSVEGETWWMGSVECLS